MPDQPSPPPTAHDLLTARQTPALRGARPPRDPRAALIDQALAPAVGQGSWLPAEAPGTPAVPERAFRFDVPAGPLRDVIAAIEQVAGVSVQASRPELLDIPSPGVRGTMTPALAVQQAVLETGVSFRLTGPRAYLLDLPSLSEAVEVSGRASILSSPKYTEPLQDTPQTIVVIPATILQEQQVTTLGDALRSTPGITLHAGEGGSGAGDNIYIRGFSAANDVYADGVRDPGVLSRDTFNVERIEVAKGPSSVTTGRGSAGGSVNLVTKDAQLDAFSHAQITAGTADVYRTTIDTNHQISDGAAFRLNGMWQDAGVPRRDAVRNGGWGIAPSLALGLDGETQLTLHYQHVHLDSVPDYGLPATLPALADAKGVTIDQLDFSNFYGLTSRDRQVTDGDAVSAVLTHRLTAATTLRNLTRFGRNRLDLVVTPPRAASAGDALEPGYDPRVPQIRRTDTKYRNLDDRTLTNQTDVTTHFRTGALTHALVTGLELTREYQPAYSVTDAFANGLPPVTGLFDPTPSDPYAPDLRRTGATSDGTAVTVAPYAFDTVDVTDRWQLSLGARWDRVSARYAAVAAPVGEEAGVATTFDRTDQAPSVRAGVVYKPGRAATCYAAYSTSFAASFDGAWGLTLSDTGRNANAALPPQKSRNAEIGTKWDLANGRLLVTGALFHTEMINAQTTNDAGQLVLAGNQQVTGVEVDASGALTRRWSLFGGLSLMHSKVQASEQDAEVGQRLAYVPKVSLSAWSTYDLPWHVTAGGGVQYNDGYFFDNTNALTSANRAAIQALTKYWLFDAMASAKVNDHLTLQVNARNLSNARYVDRGYNGHFIPGPGRSLAITPVISF